MYVSDLNTIIHNNNYSLLNFIIKALSTTPNVSNFSYSGLGNNQRKRCERPFSELDGMSINDLATPGCVNPPTVRLVELMVKLASPLTVKLSMYGL